METAVTTAGLCYKPPFTTRHWPADVVAVGAAEEVDGARRLLGQAAAAERDHLVHGGDAAALHADLDLAALHLDLARLALAQRLGEARLDVAEGHGVHRHVVAAELLGQRLGQADDARLAGRVVRLAGVAVDARGRRDVDDLAHDAPALGALLLDGLAEMLLEGAQDAERRGQMHVEDGVPLLVGHLLDHASQV
jgi:hypothetical protein